MKYIDPSNNQTGSEYIKRKKCLDGEFSIASPATNVRKIIFTLGLGPLGTTFNHSSALLAKDGELLRRVNTVNIDANAIMIPARNIAPVVRDTSAAPSNSPNNNNHGADRAENASRVIPS